MKKPIELDVFDGHLVLYCKGKYETKDFFEGLKRMWAIRCGYDYEYSNDDVYRYVANHLFKIIIRCDLQRIEHLMDDIHRELTWSISTPENLTPIQALIWRYRSIIIGMQVREKRGSRYYPLVRLPKPKVRVMKRILRGNGRYQDYEVIC